MAPLILQSLPPEHWVCPRVSGPRFQMGAEEPNLGPHAVQYALYKLTRLSGPPSNLIYFQYCSKAQMNDTASQCKGYGMTPPAIQYQSLRSAGLLQKPHI